MAKEQQAKAAHRETNRQKLKEKHARIKRMEAAHDALVAALRAMLKSELIGGSIGVGEYRIPTKVRDAAYAALAAAEPKA